MALEMDPGEVAAEVERLVTQLAESSDPAVGPRAEALVRALAGLYGEGLERILGVIRETAPDPGPLLEGLVADALVASLLILHGLHPVDLETRIERALDRVRPYLASHDGGVEVAGLDGEGVLHLRLMGGCDGCASSEATVRGVVERAVLEAAPEVTRLEVAVPASRFADDDLLPVLSVPAPPPRPEWRDVPGFALADGELRALNVGERRVLFGQLAGQLYAYDARCPRCGDGLEAAALDGETLVCSSCECRFHLRLAGRRLTGKGRPLNPVPLLVEEGRVSVAIDAR